MARLRRLRRLWRPVTSFGRGRRLHRLRCFGSASAGHEATKEFHQGHGFYLTRWYAVHAALRELRFGFMSVGNLQVPPAPRSLSTFLYFRADIPERRTNYFSKLTNEEYKYRQYLIDYLKENGFSYVDLAPSLRAMVQQPYFENADGHPNAIGQKEIATRLLEHVGSCKH